MRVVALIPAYNEAKSILQTIEAVSNIAPLDEIVVINDGSTDNTAVLIKGYKGVTLLDLEYNQGKGTALNHAWQKTSSDVYLLLDGDLGSTASLGQALLDPILEGRAHMTIARLGLDQSLTEAKMGFGLVRRCASLGIRLLTGVTIHSPLSGQRAVKAEVLHALGGFFSGFGVEVGLTAGALHHGFEVIEIPLPMKHRAWGRGFRGMRHRGLQFVAVLRSLWLCFRKGWHL